jgi:thioredoxin
MKFFRPITTFAFLVTLSLTACFGNPSENSQGILAVATVDKAQTISEAEFKKLVMDFEGNFEEWNYQGKLPSIVSFTASWCPPCRRMNPILDELAKEYAGKVNIYKVDVDHSKKVSAAFGVQNVPTLLFSPMKGMPALQPGAMNKEQFIHAIENFLLKKD